MTKIRPEPCSSCPYRRDVPSGLWAWSEYEKLRDYDRPTAEQPSAVFACHATPEAYCNGWALAHNNRGPDPMNPLSVHPYDLFALRWAESRGDWDGVMPDSKTPLFASGSEAADHGQRDIDRPSPEAIEAVARLTRKYPRLEMDNG
jgi:Family of unknown function (DUF6283)